MNSIKFVLPSIPPSMNQIYSIIPYWSTRKIRVELRDDVKRWKSSMKEYMPLWVPKGISHIRIRLDYHADFFFKNGKVRKIDLSNLEKVAIDAIAEKYGFDDCLIWKKITRKFQLDEEKGHGFIECYLGEIKEKENG